MRQLFSFFVRSQIFAATDGGKDVFVHITAVEKAGMNDLREGQKVSFDEEKDSKSGKFSAANLKAAD